jgi:hypothetical protein
MIRLKVIKPLRINEHLLNVGDEFEVAEVKEDLTTKATFFRPANVKGMPKGTFWLFTNKTFKVIA